MAKVPVSITYESSGGGQLRQDISLTASQLNNLLATAKKLESEQANLLKSVSKLTTGFEGLASGVKGFASTAATSFKNFGSGGALSGILSQVGELDKKMFNLSKTAALTGQSFAAMKKGIDQLNQSTALSVQDSTEFFRVVSEGTRGVRMNASEVAKLGKLLSDEFGPSLEDVTGAFQRLSQLQEKDIFLFRRLNESMDAERLGAYAARLIVVNKATQQQINDLFRVAYAKQMGSKAQSEEQRRLIEYQQIVQEFHKTFQDLTINVGRQMMPAFKAIVPYIKMAAEKISELLKNNPGIIKLVGQLILLGPAVGAAGRMASGLGGMLGGLGGGLKNLIGGGLAGLIGGGAVGRDGSSASKALYVRDVGSTGGMPPLEGGGGTGAGGWLQRQVVTKGFGAGMSPLARTGAAIGGAAIIAGGQIGGSYLDEAGHTKAGAWSRMGGNIAGGALTGLAIAGPIGALAGAVAGLGGSINDLANIIENTTDEARKTRAHQQWVAETAKKQEQKRATAVEEAVKQTGGMGPDDPRFAATLALSKAVEKRLVTGGMSQKEARGEIEAAAQGQASSAYLRTVQKVTPGEIAAQTGSVKQDFDAMTAGEGEGRLKKVNDAVASIGEGFKLIREQNKALSFQNVMQETAETKALIEGMTGDLREQANTELELYGNVAKANELYAQAEDLDNKAVAMMQQRRDELKEMLGKHGSMKDVMQKINELQNKRNEATKEGVGFSREDEKTLNEMVGNLNALQIMNRNIADSKKAQAADQRAQAASFDAMARLEGNRLGLMEAQAAVAKEMYLGAGPTLEFQSQMLQQTERLKSVEQARQDYLLSKINALKEGDKERVDLQNQLLESKQKESEISLKQLQITKQLREGYLDALQTMTNAEGTFAKFVLRKDMGAAAMQRQLAAAGGMRVGALGAGGEGPAVRWKPGGGPGALQFLGPEAFARRAAGYGEEFSPGVRINANVGTAISQTPMGEFGNVAPETGARRMTGGGPGVNVQSPIQPSPGAASGGFEGQVLGKMDDIIKMFSGTGTPPKGIQQAVQGGTTAANKEAPPGFWRKTQGTAAAMSQTTEEDRMSAAENASAQRFEEFRQKFSDWDMSGVNTSDISIGKGGKGPIGVQYGGGPKGGPMTTKGVVFGPEFTPEQVRGSSRWGAGGGVPGGAGARGTAGPVGGGMIYDENDKVWVPAASQAGITFETSTSGGSRRFTAEDATIDPEKMTSKGHGISLIDQEPPAYDPHRQYSFAEAEQRMGYLRGKRTQTTSDFEDGLKQQIEQGDRELSRLAAQKAMLGSANLEDAGRFEVAKMGAEEKGRTEWDAYMKEWGYDIADKLDEINYTGQEGIATQREVGQEIASTIGKGDALSAAFNTDATGPGITDWSGGDAGSPGGGSPGSPGGGEPAYASMGGMITRMASGGRLPGFGGGDRVLAMLEPGEFVVNKDAARAFPGLLESINKNRFQTGGTVGLAPSPSLSRQGGSITPRFNISVRGDTARSLVGSVNRTLSGILNDMFVPQGTSGRSFDLGT